jgi:ankyrin repeat protein
MPAKKGKKTAPRKPAKRPTRAALQLQAYVRATELLRQIEQSEQEDAELLDAVEPEPAPKTSKADADLVSAAYYGDLAHAKKALAAGASPDARDDISGHTALYLAVAQNREAMVRLLLARGADPNATVIANIRGVKIREISPLYRALEERKRAIVRILKSHGGCAIGRDA